MKLMKPSKEEHYEYRSRVTSILILTTLACMVILTIYNIIFPSVGDDGTYDWYLSNFIAIFLIYGIYVLHKRYPTVARNIFVLQFVLGAIFLIHPDALNVVFSAMAIPIIIAAFLIGPIYSFVYLGIITVLYSYRFLTVVDSSVFNYVGLISLVIIAVVAWLIAVYLERSINEILTLNQELDERVRIRTSELAAALEREQAILFSIADGVVVVDPEKVLMANPAANEWAGQPLERLTRGEFLSSINVETREVVDNWLAGGLPEGAVHFQWGGRTISVNISPLSSEKGTAASEVSIVALRDFTREAALEKAKNVFLGMVSHELRTPIAAIQGYAGVLARMELPQEVEEFIAVIRENGNRLLALVNELIDLSRLEAGEVELYPSYIEVPDLIESTIRVLRKEYENRGLYLNYRLDTSSLPPLYIDRDRIYQVILNILSNGYKYTTQGGLTITIQNNGDSVTMKFQDTGIGIKPEDQEKIFQRFFRANNTVTQKAGGTGLGLSISKSLVELHGGRLTFESVYEEGTTFTLTLPIK